MRSTNHRALALTVALGVGVAGVATLTAVPAAVAAPARHTTARQHLARSSGASTPAGPFTVTMTNREDVRQFYYRVHEASNGVDPGWTGSIGTCNPGSVAQAFLDATATRLNYFRAMAGVPSNVTFNATYNQPAQAAALMMSAQNDLSHDPPNTWACWSQSGHDGAASSNLGLGSTGPDGIDQFMYDGGTNNTDAGHRRNMLYVGTNVMGSGDVPATSGHAAASALYVNTPSVNPVPTPRDTFMAWPPKGDVPYQVVYPRWTFSLADADFTNATVTMSQGGNNVPLTVQGRNGLFGDPAIVWIPSVSGVSDGNPWPNPGTDSTYTVTVSNLTVGGNAAGPYTYNVTIIDPSTGDAAHAPGGPANPPVGQNSTYTVPAIPNASGYQWRTTPLTTSTLNDGAESGLGNWTASVDGYNPIQSAHVASGSNAFQLYITQFNNPDTLTLNRTLLPNASSQLSFDSEASSFDHLDASMQVSGDGGTTWATPPIFDQAGGNESSFSHKTVSLASYAGKDIQLRFVVRYAFDGGGVCLCSSNAWYFDNVALSNTQELGTPVSSGVGASPSFSFDPPSAGQYAVDVRPQYSNPTVFGQWSQPTTVAATSGSCSGCPGAPTIAFATSGSGWVTVGWSAPSSSGTSAITSYVVTTSPGNQTVTVPAAARRAVVSVPNGTQQTAKVAAVNDSGTGPASSASASFAPAAASINVTTQYDDADNTRLSKNATYFAQTASNAQRTSVGIIAYIVGIVHSATLSPTAPPTISGTHSYTTSYSTSEQSALVSVMRQYGLSPTEAQYFSVMLVGYLLALGGH